MDAENDSGATALMVAAHNGHTEVVEALIDAGLYMGFKWIISIP